MIPVSCFDAWYPLKMVCLSKKRGPTNIRSILLLSKGTYSLIVSSFIIYNFLTMSVIHETPSILRSKKDEVIQEYVWA